MSTDPEAAAVARAAAQRRRLREENDFLGADAVAVILGATSAAIDETRRQDALLAVEEDGMWHYPAWQFSEGEVLGGLAEVLAAIRAIPIRSAWATLDFLTARDAADDESTMVELLRAGRVDEALAVAHQYGEAGQ